MGKVLTQLSLATLVAAGSIMILSKPMPSAVDAVDFGNAGIVVVGDAQGYFIVTIGQVQMIFATDASSG